MTKDLGQILIENAKKESGGCWMQDFVPIIKKSVKEWIEQTLECTCKSESPDTMCDYCFLLAQINENKPIKPEGQ